MGNNNSSHHIIPFEVLKKTLFTLLVLTIITVVASRIDFGFMNVVIAVAIASVKAIIVASFFMGLKYEGMINRVCFIIGFLFLGLLWAFSVADIWWRVNPRA